MDQEKLWDKNIDKKIVKCYINPKGRFKNEVFVVYEDGAREVIFSYDPNRMDYDYTELIGKTKLEAIFEYDHKRTATFKSFYSPRR